MIAFDNRCFSREAECFASRSDVPFDHPKTPPAPGRCFVTRVNLCMASAGDLASPRPSRPHPARSRGSEF
jgi:hypothetical protein